jgi:hypothetical protein
MYFSKNTNIFPLHFQPQDAYRKALDRMRVEAADLGLPVEECFPEWPKLRQQYCRIRKQAVRQRQQEKWEWMMMARGAGLPPGQVCLPSKFIITIKIL